MYYSIVHLVDDSQPGDVTRMLDFITNAPEMARSGVHKVVQVKRGQVTAPRLAADLIVSHLPISWLNLPLFASLRAAYPRTPLVHVEHTFCERFAAQNVRSMDRFDTLMHSATAIFDHVVAVSEAQAAWLRRKGYGPGGRISVIEPCVGLASCFATPQRVPAAPVIVGFMGRAETKTGLDILIDAFKDRRLSAMALHVHAEGNLLETLRARAGGAVNILFKGPAADPAAAIAACDLIAMPSRWEPCGLLALEAMACGRPLACSRADGLATRIAGGAVEVAINTPDCWAEVLSLLPRLDLDLARVRGRLHAQAVGKQFVVAWTSLIQSAVGAPDYGRVAA
jgi:glycosyltransferase involved in cell wall biosynthesis